jgi:hypothetical protein
MKVGSTVGSGKVIRGSGWNAGGAAFCGGVLGAVAVMGHEVYTVFIGRCPSVDPFTYVHGGAGRLCSGRCGPAWDCSQYAHLPRLEDLSAHRCDHNLPSAGRDLTSTQ